MTKYQRNWARLQQDYYCSDSKVIWFKDKKGELIKFTSFRKLKARVEEERK